MQIVYINNYCTEWDV